MAQTIEGQLREVLVRTIDVRPDDITHNARLVTDMGASEFDMIEVMLEVEWQFQIAITDADYDACETFGDLVNLVSRSVGGRH